MSRRYPAVVPLTFPGKILVAIMRATGWVLSLFYAKKFQTPKPNFEENPRTYTASDILFFGYKYYYDPPEKAASAALESRFREARFVFPKAEKQKQDEVSISVGGDLMPYAWLTQQSCQHLWDDLGPWFFASDIVFANLETPADFSKKPGIVPEVMLNNMYFNAPAEMFNIFNGLGRYKGFDVLSTANNHSLDQGESGIKATLELLKEKGIASCGTSTTNVSDSIAYVEESGIRFAFVAATNSLNQLLPPPGKEYLVNLGNYNQTDPDITLLQELCAEARSKADIVLLSLHTGNAYQAYPNAHTVKNMEQIADACRPDVILGSHPHNPQGVEQLQLQKKEGLPERCFVIYSPGDFVAYDIFTWCHLHLAFKLKFSRLEGIAQLIGFEVNPSFLALHGSSKKPQFQFHGLLDEDAYENASAKRKAEWRELRRFWEKHLAPTLHPYLTQPFV